MKKRNYLSDVEDRSGNAFSVIADFEGNEEQLMEWMDIQCIMETII